MHFNFLQTEILPNPIRPISQHQVSLNASMANLAIYGSAQGWSDPLVSFTKEILCLSIILEYLLICLFLCLGSFISFFSQGAVIEPCAKEVYFVHLFKQTQTFNAFKNL